MCADDIYGGALRDVIFRCALLSKAALEAACNVPCGGSPYGEANLLFIANDWHTSLLPVYLQVKTVQRRKQVLIGPANQQQLLR